MKVLIYIYCLKCPKMMIWLHSYMKDWAIDQMKDANKLAKQLMEDVNH